MRVVEFGFLLIGLCLLFLRAVKDGLHGEHSNNAEDLVGAAHINRVDQAFGESRLHGEVGHLASKAGQ